MREPCQPKLNYKESGTRTPAVPVGLLRAYEYANKLKALPLRRLTRRRRRCALHGAARPKQRPSEPNYDGSTVSYNKPPYYNPKTLSACDSPTWPKLDACLLSVSYNAVKGGPKQPAASQFKRRFPFLRGMHSGFCVVRVTHRFSRTVTRTLKLRSRGKIFY